uniref:Nuclear nucleic acid-binding protein C1D n=1 Tax=Phallusia mammillata TaxID=59560 RepID=A0A6F9D792_9ASCI|nr:nuclear nucleic acid-binding protein C1D [Phallusia mammillata]
MSEDDYPEELNDVFKSFDSSLRNVMTVMTPLLETERSEIVRKLPSLDVAKLDLVTAYAVNSMFWGFLLTQGVNPKLHPVKQELERIKTYMTKIKDIEERKYAPKLAKEAAKRFVRSAMFEQNESKTKETINPSSEELQPNPLKETKSKTPKKHKRSKKFNHDKKKKKRKLDS